MSTINTPNMNLSVPTVGQEAGPDYAFDINAALSLLDGHDHSPGRGVQITPNGLNINSVLSMNNNVLSAIAALTLLPQTTAPAINSLYESGTDLYFVDGLGNNVRLTQSGAVAGAPGSISNLVAPASASYVSASQKFVWQSGSNIAANMDFGSAIMRNLSPNSTFALTLQPPASLASNYSITLPTIPSSTAFMTLDNSGSMSGSIPISGGITATNIASATITSTQVAVSTLTGGVSGNIAQATIDTTNISATAGITPTQLDSLSSAVTGDYFAVSTSSGSFSTTTSATAIPLTGVPTNLNPNRPLFINFTWDGVGSAASIQQTISANQTSAAIFLVQQSNGSTVHTVASYQMNTIAIPGTGVVMGIPPGALNTVIQYNPSFGGSFRLQVSTISGASVQVTNVVMQLFQV